ncbi:MAG TPA: ATP-binding cassette domain-containing protein [Papillibacter sp.]|nr:ATP-binding cassette domain-containing protein [Papillibacter sp.]
MALDIDIVKRLPGFTLRVRLKAEDEIVGLLGASGSGKSMTLKCIAGIETPDEGVILLNGRALFDSDRKINLPPRRRRTGFLFQSAALFPNMTVEQNIQCVLKDKTREEKRRITQDVLSRLGLSGLELRYPSELSGGQRQRAALARILVTQPDIIMLDEPFSALDSYLRWQLEQELSSVLRDFGGTSLFVSHNRDEAYRLCDTLAVLSSGEIAAAGDKWAIFNDPQSYAACLLTGCKNITPAHQAGDFTVSAADWGVTLRTEAKAAAPVRYVGIRAHDVVFTDSLALPNTFPFELVEEMRDTFSYIFMLRLSPHAAPLRVEISREQYQALKKLPQYVQLPPGKLLLLTRD